MSVVTLKLQKIEPPELLAEALPDALFERLRMKRYPVQISQKKQSDYGGYCNHSNYTEHDEIVLSYILLEVPEPHLRAWRCKRIKSTYMHECAHRILNCRTHSAEFLALNMLLHLRAGDDMIHYIDVYDFHEEEHFERAFAWAWRVASELAESNLSAEECGKNILEKYDAWQDWMASAAERKADADERQKIAEAERKWMISEIVWLQNKCWHIGFICLIAGGLLAHFGRTF